MDCKNYQGSSTFISTDCSNTCSFISQIYTGEVTYGIYGSDMFQMESTKLFNQSGDDISLLGLSPRYSNEKSSFIETIYKQLNISSEHQVFSLQLGEEKGKLIVGQDYDNYKEIGIPYNASSHYYSIGLTSIQDDDGNEIYQKQKDDDNYKFIVDSGATLLNLQPDLLTKFQRAFEKCKHDPRGCPQQLQTVGVDCYLYEWKKQGDISNFFDLFPSYSFTFTNGYIYILTAQDYLLKSGLNIYCVPLDDYTRNYEQKYQKISLLGQPFMRYKEFTFDQTSNQIYIKSRNQLVEKGYGQYLYPIIVIVVIALILSGCNFLYKRSRGTLSQMFNVQARGFNPYQ